VACRSALNARCDSHLHGAPGPQEAKEPAARSSTHTASGSRNQAAKL
jgi:hypothetical protein